MNRRLTFSNFDNYTFSKLIPADLPELVLIHIKAFPNFFLTKLGSKVLTIFYGSLIHEKSTVAWCLKNDNIVLGFFVTSTSYQGLYKHIFKKNYKKFAFPIFMVFLKKPQFFFRMIIAYRTQSSYLIPDFCTASLLSICVNPEFSGRGIGKSLIEKNDEELKEIGVHGYFLTTDAENNIATNSFYRKNNFDLNSFYYQGKRKMNLYTKMLS